jgi:hypothetical protein
MILFATLLTLIFAATQVEYAIRDAIDLRQLYAREEAGTL